MKRIPTSYISLQKNEAFLRARKWLSRGLSEIDMAKQLCDRYGKTDSETERLFILRLLALAYYKEYGISETVTKMTNYPVIKGISPAETAFVGAFTSDFCISWNKNYNIGILPDILEVPTQSLPQGIMPYAQMPALIRIADNIYCMRNHNGGLELFLIEDIAADILIDEERFADEAPLYFTEKTHFFSPVFKLRVMNTIIDFLLTEIGYPPMQVNCTAIFTRGTLINFDDYANGEEGGWENVSVVQLRTLKDAYVFPHPLPVELTDENILIDCLYQGLAETLRAAARIYFECERKNFYIELTDDVLRSIIKKLAIFKPGRA